MVTTKAVKPFKSHTDSADNLQGPPQHYKLGRLFNLAEAADVHKHGEIQNRAGSGNTQTILDP